MYLKRGKMGGPSYQTAGSGTVDGSSQELDTRGQQREKKEIDLEFIVAFASLDSLSSTLYDSMPLRVSSILSNHWTKERGAKESYLPCKTGLSSDALSTRQTEGIKIHCFSSNPLILLVERLGSSTKLSQVPIHHEESRYEDGISYPGSKRAVRLFTGRRVLAMRERACVDQSLSDGSAARTLR
jgi:hypothetical protein